MNKRAAILIVAALLLAAIYVVGFTDWFRKGSIQIYYRTMPARGPKGRPLMVFYLSKKVSLNEIKVVSSDQLKTNKFPHTYWHLIAEKGSPPVIDFPYGSPVPGMKPKIPNLPAEPLEPGPKYVLMIQAGKAKGQVEFTFKP